MFAEKTVCYFDNAEVILPTAAINIFHRTVIIFFLDKNKVWWRKGSQQVEAAVILLKPRLQDIIPI